MSAAKEYFNASTEFIEGFNVQVRSGLSGPCERTNANGVDYFTLVPRTERAKKLFQGFDFCPFGLT